jgi:hypothetical protein
MERRIEKLYPFLFYKIANTERKTHIIAKIKRIEELNLLLLNLKP